MKGLPRPERDWPSLVSLQPSPPEQRPVTEFRRQPPRACYLLPQALGYSFQCPLALSNISSIVCPL